MPSLPVYFRKHVFKLLSTAQTKLERGYGQIVNEVLEENLEEYIKKKLTEKRN